MIWKYHLQQMVLADDPIKYLADHMYQEGVSFADLQKQFTPQQ